MIKQTQVWGKAGSGQNDGDLRPGPPRCSPRGQSTMWRRLAETSVSCPLGERFKTLQPSLCDGGCGLGRDCLVHDTISGYEAAG